MSINSSDYLKQLADSLAGLGPILQKHKSKINKCSSSNDIDTEIIANHVRIINLSAQLNQTIKEINFFLHETDPKIVDLTRESYKKSK